MVKIPELAEDGQNWKIYHAKFLEVAATYDCLEVLAGRPYKGEDWDGCNALLCCTFMESIPPSIYFRRLRYTAHENFKYLAKRFRDNEPIPRANELQCAGTAAAAETPENYPMSDSAATERHASAERNKEDLSNTTQDPCTSTEAPAMGTSTKCIETTPVVLEGTPHELQTELQNSLPLTPRLPIEGEPSGCKQEAADSNVTAGRMNGMAEMAKPTIADIDRTARLGVELTSEACGVDEGDGTEHRDLWLQQTNSYCKESRQRNEIANENVPSTYELPLEGEWTVFASGEARDPKGDANASDAATEHVYHPSESRMTEDANGVESEGCREGVSIDVAATECCQQLVGMADGGPSHGVEPAEMSNVSKTLVTMSVELEDLHRGGILCVCLGNRADMSTGQTDALSIETDTSRSANVTENVNICNGSVFSFLI